MYLRYFALQDHPFAITPDPAFLYLSAHHREALGHLLYGTGEHGGFVQLTGEVGTGKTTLIRALLEQDHDVTDVDVALCLNPQLTVNELLAAICDELDVDYSTKRKLTLKHLVDCLNAHLLATHAAGRRTVLIIDEAQNLSREVLEQVRLLTNLETGKHKLLRIILVGQPELEEILARPDLRQLAQRITARFHLPGLSRSETDAYIRHRLRVAGGDPNTFSAAACATVYRYSSGTPRLINTICERALMGAYAQEKRPVTPAIVRQAAKETLPRSMLIRQDKPWEQILPVAVLLGAALLAFVLNYFLQPEQSLVTPATEIAALQIEDTTFNDHQPKNSAKVTAPTPAVSYELPESDARMSQLLRLWGVFGEEVKVSCRALKIGDLRCMQGQASLDKIAKFNHPALVTLRQGDITRRVLISNLDEANVTLVSTAGTLKWPREALENLWAGDYQMIWRQQTSTSRIENGSVGNSVVWLRRQLAAHAGQNIDTKAGQPSPIFDAELSSRLEHFQYVNDLEVDGVVGPRTMAMLNTMQPAPGTPLLNSEPVATKPKKPIPEPVATEQSSSSGCIPIQALPAAKELTRLYFAANSVNLSSRDKTKIADVATEAPKNTKPLIVVGTSFNSSMAAEQLQELALERAQAVADHFVELGIPASDLRCMARTGEQAPTKTMDRVAVIYRALDSLP